MGNEASSSIFEYDSFGERLDDLRQRYRRKLSGEHTNPPSKNDTAEALAQMVLTMEALQSILGRAAGGSGDHLPGENVSVQTLIDQMLTAEAGAETQQRVEQWIRRAIDQLRKTHRGVEKELSSMRQGVVNTFQPRSIETATPVALWRRLLGLQGGAYWREYSNRFKHLDASGVIRLLDQKSG